MNTEKLKANSSFIAFAAVILGNVFWGFSFIWIKVTQNYVDSTTLLSHRFVAAFLIMNLMMLFNKNCRIKHKGKELLPIFYLGIFDIFYFLFESLCIKYANASLASVILSITPLIVLVFGIIFLKEYPTKKQVLFCIPVVIGAVIVTGGGGSIGAIKPLGVLFMILTGLSAGGFRTINRKYSAMYSSFERTYFIMGICAVAYTTVVLARSNFDVAAYIAPLKDFGYVRPMLSLVIFCSLLANLLVNYSYKYLPLLITSVIGTVSTIVSVLGGVFILHEPMTVLMAVGIVMIVVGIYKVSEKK